MNLRWIKLKKKTTWTFETQNLWRNIVVLEQNYSTQSCKSISLDIVCISSNTYWKCFLADVFLATHVMPQSSSTISISTWGKWCASDRAPPSLEPSLLCSEHVPSAPGRQKNILKHEHQLSFCWTCSSYNNNLYGFQKIELVADRFKCKPTNNLRNFIVWFVPL